MITGALMDFGYTILSTMWGWVPAWDITGPDVTTIQNLKYYISQFNGFVPVTEFFSIVGISISAIGVVYFVKLVIKIGDWITALIP